jgi:hypothetical protein
MKYDRTDHALAVGDIYFTLQPDKWMYEPTEDFSCGVWAPDCIFVHNKKVWVVEVQRSPCKWAKKWKVFNDYFKDEFKGATFQKWGSKGTILPQFAVLTHLPNAQDGFNIEGRELKVITDISQL